MDFSRPSTPNLGALFGGTHHVPGLGYVSGTGADAHGALGDEAAVMMVSGLGDETDFGTKVTDGAARMVGARLTDALKAPVTIGVVTQPLWVWLVLALGGVGIAGWFFFKRK